LNNPLAKPDAGDASPPIRGGLIERPDQLPGMPVPQPETPGGPEDDSISLREYWDIIVRRKWTVLTCFAIVVVAMMTATFLMTRIYRATLTLQVEQQESKAIAIQGIMQNDQGYETENYLQTQFELLKSDALAQRVVEQLNLVASPATEKKDDSWLDIFRKVGDKPEAAKAEPADTGLASTLPGELTVVPVRNSRLVKVNFDSPDPEMAARVANAIAVAFINLNL